MIADIPYMLFLPAVALGLLAGLLIGLFLLFRTKSASQREGEALKIRVATLEKEREADVEKLQWTEQAESKLREAFAALASEALIANTETLTKQAQGDLKNLVNPLKENLTSLDSHIRELESKRKGT